MDSDKQIHKINKNYNKDQQQKDYKKKNNKDYT